MADPVLKTITTTAWNKVATNVYAGFISLATQTTSPARFAVTYRDTGGAAPSNADNTDGNLALVLEPGLNPIESSSAIDIYVIATSGEGTVRVAV